MTLASERRIASFIRLCLSGDSHVGVSVGVVGTRTETVPLLSPAFYVGWMDGWNGMGWDEMGDVFIAIIVCFSGRYVIVLYIALPILREVNLRELKQIHRIS